MGTYQNKFDVVVHLEGFSEALDVIAEHIVSRRDVVNALRLAIDVIILPKDYHDLHKLYFDFRDEIWAHTSLSRLEVNSLITELSESRFIYNNQDKVRDIIRDLSPTCIFDDYTVDVDGAKLILHFSSIVDD